MRDDEGLIRARRRRREAEGRRRSLVAVGVVGAAVTLAACVWLTALLRRHQPTAAVAV